MIKSNELREGITLNIFDPENVGINPVTIDKQRLIALLTGEETTYYPIPLTPEILEGCGFDKEQDKERLSYSFKLGQYEFLQMRRGYVYKGGSTKILYLHQLQNLYFALTGEELQINQIA